MRIIVSDTSCIIDLHKAGLLEDFIGLPESIVIPQPLFDDEVLSLGKQLKKRLVRIGLEVQILPGDSVARAGEYFNRYRALKIHDCFALVAAEKTEQSVLLTGDSKLAAVAKEHGVRTHGVIWATDKMYSHKVCKPAKLRQGMKILSGDPLVYIPDHLIQTRITQKYK